MFQKRDAKPATIPTSRSKLTTASDTKPGDGPPRGGGAAGGGGVAMEIGPGAEKSGSNVLAPNLPSQQIAGNNSRVVLLSPSLELSLEEPPHQRSPIDRVAGRAGDPVVEPSPPARPVMPQSFNHNRPELHRSRVSVHLERT